MSTSEPREARARALLAAHPQGRALATAPFQRLVGGALNRSWRVETAQGAYFLRLADQEAQRLGADWESEAVLLAIASAAGFAPRPLLAIPGEGLLVCEFLAGRVLSTREVRTPARIEKIGQLLRAVHDLPPSPGIRQLDFAVQARALEAQLDAGNGARFRIESVAVFERLAASRRPAVPCHNDVHAGNLLESGSHLVLLDWEYGGIGDPVYDLAGCACNMSLDDGQRRSLLDEYEAPAVALRLDDACWAYDYVQWLWYRVAAARGGEKGANALAAAAAAIEGRLERPGVG